MGKASLPKNLTQHVENLRFRLFTLDEQLKWKIQPKNLRPKI
jgi:hypothetical protein